MANQYTCYVPKAWNVYSEKVLENIIASKATDQWKHYRNLEGTTIRLRNVTAKFNYFQFSPWLRKADDKNSYPHTDEYYEIEMDCILCSRACRNWGRRVCVYD